MPPVHNVECRTQPRLALWQVFDRAMHVVVGVPVLVTLKLFWYVGLSERSSTAVGAVTFDAKDFARIRYRCQHRDLCAGCRRW